jgi:tetratricopeptide (TPR) repeat protein
MDAKAQETLDRAMACYDRDQFEEAAAAFAEVLQLDPTCAAAHYHRGECLLAQNDPRAALADFDAAVRLDPADGNHVCARACALVQLGEDDRALADFSAALAVNPRSAFACKARGDLHFRRGSYEEALVDYTSALDIDPDYAEAHLLRGACHDGLGCLDEALADCEHGLRLDPANVRGLSFRATLRHRLDDLPGAIADYSAALAAGHDQPASMHLLRGVAHHEGGDAARARADYDEALRLDPQLSEAWNNRGLLRDQAGDHAGALDDLTAAITTSPDNPVFVYNRGYSHREHGEGDAAVADLRAGLALDSAAILLFLDEAEVLFPAEQYEPDIVRLSEELARRPAAANLWFQRGQAYFKGKAYDQAENDFSRAIALDNDPPAYFNHRGRVRLLLGKEEGMDDFAQAAFRDPRRLRPADRAYGSYDAAGLFRGSLMG